MLNPWFYYTHEVFLNKVDTSCQSIKKPGFNQLTLQLQWAYCGMPGDLGVRIRKGEGEILFSFVPGIYYKIYKD